MIERSRSWCREAFTRIGLLSFAVGAAAVDSDGVGFLIAVGILAVGLLCVWVGTKVVR